MKPTTYKKLNLGCGTSYRSDWVNIDVAPVSSEILKFDLKSGIPFPDTSFDAVYHSHVLEHLTPDDGFKLIRDCARVLKPGGILRIAVPDLESIARVYLEKLDAASNGKPGADGEYRWIILELLDQMVREKSGGKMAEFLAEPTLPQLPFIVERIGDEGSELREKLLRPATDVQTLNPFFKRLVTGICSGSLVHRIRLIVLHACVRILGGKNVSDAFNRGWFRSTGEVHQWMYDRYSLKKLLQAHGFESVQLLGAEESAIEGFQGSGLEIKNGRTRKPDSLFIEGIRSRG